MRVEFKGFFRFEHLAPFLYLGIKSDWQTHRNITLPPYGELEKFGRPKDLRILLEPITLTIKYPNSSWRQFKFSEGWISDLASVPWFFRSVVDNDDAHLLSAAMCHDYLFSTHDLPFDETNKLFRQMAKALGYPRGLANLAWIAVASPFGKKRWRENLDLRGDWTRKTAQFLNCV